VKPSPVTVRIKNFQSIGSLELEVSGFTCVTGPTNIGKSAIVRAVSGALLGSPVVGDVRRGQKFCTVELVSDGWSLKWEKGERGVNRYWIPADTESPLDKVGKGQIPQIEALGFGSVKIGDDVVQPWFAGQFEPVFLMNKSGPAVTDFLSEVSRLKVLQDGITINVRNRKRALDRAKIREEDAQKFREREEKFEKVGDMVQLREELEAQMESIQDYGDRLTQLQEFLSSIEEEADSIKALRQAKDVKAPADVVSSPMEDLRKRVSAYATLEDEAAKIIAYKPAEGMEAPDAGELGELIDGLSAAGKMAVRLAAEAKVVEALSAMASVPDAPEMPDGLARMSEIAAALTAAREDVARLQSDSEAVEGELSKVQTEIDSIPVCPTCRRPLGTGQHVSP